MIDQNPTPGDGSAPTVPARAPTASERGGRASAPAAAETGTLLEVRGLKKYFPIYGGLLRRQIGTVYAVDGVDIDVRAGEIFSLVGESGCGKTTMGRTILRLTDPTAGKVLFDGKDVTAMTPDERQQLGHPLARCGPARQAVDRERLAQHAAHREARIEARVGILEHDLHLAAQAPELALRHPGDLPAGKGDVPRTRLEESQQAAPGRGLAAAALSH